MRWSVGGSVANARAPSVSIIRLTQRSWKKAVRGNQCLKESKSTPIQTEGNGERWQTCTALSGTLPEESAATTLITRAATLTVSWNCMNFWILAYTDLPHRTTCNAHNYKGINFQSWYFNHSVKRKGMFLKNQHSFIRPTLSTQLLNHAREVQQNVMTCWKKISSTIFKVL